MADMYDDVERMLMNMGYTVSYRYEQAPRPGKMENVIPLFLKSAE